MWPLKKNYTKSDCLLESRKKSDKNQNGAGKYTVVFKPNSIICDIRQPASRALVVTQRGSLPVPTVGTLKSD